MIFESHFRDSRYFIGTENININFDNSMFGRCTNSFSVQKHSIVDMIDLLNNSTIEGLGEDIILAPSGA